METFKLNQLSPKELRDAELVTFHRDLIENLMKNKLAWALGRRKKVMKLYDIYINPSNIRYYLCRPLELFLKALLLGKLEDIANYTPKEFNA